MPKLKRRVLLGLYIAFLVVPIYWLVVMSLKTNEEILGELTIFPHPPTLANYLTIVTDRSWYMGYVNSLEYVVMNTALSLAVVALPGTVDRITDGARLKAVVTHHIKATFSGTPFCVYTTIEEIDALVRGVQYVKEVFA